MSKEPCPELEQLFIGLAEGDERMEQHLAGCPLCAAVVEEHRQLEKDLLRVSDPLPPPDFVQQVMARVEKAPLPLRREVWAGAGIFVLSVAAMVAFVLGDAATAGALGTGVASGLLFVREALEAAGTGVKAVWITAAFPLTALASVLVVCSLFAFRRLASPQQQSRVSA